jgi:archaemetzincin
MNNASEDGHIALISFGFCEGHFLGKLSQAIQREFQYPVVVRESHTDLSEFFDPSRRQYNGNKLLKMVDQLVTPDSFKTIGLFSVDLYIPILTFIFGQAYLNGRSAIVSRFRLRNEHYGLTVDENLLIDRLVKEVIHELGHTFGLIHCHAPDCVMRSSTYVEDIDQKGSRLCINCHGKLEVR